MFRFVVPQASICSSEIRPPFSVEYTYLSRSKALNRCGVIDRTREQQSANKNQIFYVCIVKLGWLFMVQKAGPPPLTYP